MKAGILLADQFIMLNLDLVIDTLRIANRVLEAPHFQWIIFTVDNNPAISCNGYVVQPGGNWADSDLLDCILVITGFEPENSLRPPVLEWLGQQHRAGVKMGCMDTGAFVLAAANALPRTPIAIHWEFEQRFRQQYPQLQLNTRGISCSERFFSASGGLSVADMMLALLAQYISPPQVEEVTHILYYHGFPPPAPPDKLPITNGSHGRIERAEACMRATLAQPLSLPTLAKMVNMHPRTFSRRFHEQYGSAPMHYYRQLRLEHARQLLQQTHWPISQIAELCGFAEATNFSACFAKHYGISPAEVRTPSISGTKSSNRKSLS